MLASTIVVLLHFPFVLVFVVVFFTPWFTFFWLLFCCLFLVCAFRFSCGVIVICVWMLSAFVRCVLAICAIVCCSVCMHVVVQCFALVRGVDIVAMFIVRCAFFCPEHVCGCSLSDVCVCVLVALVRPQRLCSEESNAYTNIAIYWCGHLCSAKGVFRQCAPQHVATCFLREAADDLSNV